VRSRAGAEVREVTRALWGRDGIGGFYGGCGWCIMYVILSYGR